MCVLIVLTVRDDILNGWVPITKNSMVKVNEIEYRIIDANWCMNKQEWDIELRREWCDLQCGNLHVSNQLCVASIRTSWISKTKGWFEAMPRIPQFDGEIIDNAHENKTNAGDELLGLIDHFDQNKSTIKKLYNEIKENGVDTNYMRKNSRYDANGFALEACNE